MDLSRLASLGGEIHFIFRIIFRRIKAWVASKKDASWQFPKLQKVSHQNIPERVMRSLSPAAFA